MITTVLWDNDGVLVDTEALFYQANREMFALHGIDLTPRHFLDWYLVDNCGAWHLLEAQGHDPALFPLMRAERNERFSELLAGHPGLVVPGIDRVLTALAGRVRMAVVTSSSRHHLELAHARTGILGLMEVVVCEDDCPTTKPAPDPYVMAMARLGVTPDVCVAVEDSPRGVAAATGAGVRCIAKRSELTAGFEFAGAWQVVETSEEILAAIEGLLFDATTGERVDVNRRS